MPPRPDTISFLRQCHGLIPNTYLPLLFNYMCPTEHSGLFDNEIESVVLQSGVNKHVRCKNAESTKRRPPAVFQYCPCCLESLQEDDC